MSLGELALGSDSGTRSAPPQRRKRAKPSTWKTDKTESRITGLEGLAPPEDRAGRRRRLVGAAAVGAGPDQAVALAVLVVEEVGVDRGGEARIVELEAQVIAALVGALGPGGADLDAADEDAVAGGVLAGAVGLGDDADVLGLDAEGDDFAGELVGRSS